jgi:hypothetical protein
MAFKKICEGEMFPKGWLWGAYNPKLGYLFLGVRLPAFKKTTQFRYELLEKVTDHYDLTICFRIGYKRLDYHQSMPLLHLDWWREPRRS